MLRSAVDMARGARKNDKGFTLIELLIVIVILGILAGIVVFSVSGITDKGKDSACETTKKTVETAYEAFIANSPTGAKPADLAALKPKFLHSIPVGVSLNVTTGEVTGDCQPPAGP